MSIVDPPGTGNAAPHPAPAKPRRTRLFPRPKTWRGWLAYLGVVALLLLLLSWGLARSTPRWYQPLDPNDNWVIDEADVGQSKILYDLHNKAERTPFGDQSWTITQDEINSWLAVQFGDPLNVDGIRTPNDAKGFSGPMVAFTPGKVTVAVRFLKLPGSNSRGGVGSAVFSVELFAAPDGTPMGRVHLTGLWLGCLPVPTSLIDSRVREAVPKVSDAIAQVLGVKNADIFNRVADAVSTGEPFPLKFNFDRRVILIRKMQVGDGDFTLTLSPPTPTAVRPRPVN